MDELTPRQIVAELDRFIVGQARAKRMVAIALRNRARRRKLPPELREEVSPKNIIMIGPTGVGKTEIARRLAKLANAPMVKVEATKYTEVGYVGRDVESMVRDLVENAISLVKAEKSAEVMERARRRAEERILDILLPPPPHVTRRTRIVDGKPESYYDIEPAEEGVEPTPEQRWLRNREKLRERLHAGKLNDREVEIETKRGAEVQVLGPMPMGGVSGSFDDLSGELRSVFEKIFPPREKRTRMTVEEALEILTQEELESLIDMDKITREALERAQESGIIFIDEIDKIAGRSSGHGPDVSREGVQRDILPIVEGCVVNTKYGPIRTDHILFIAAGAFHMTKPSDLIPELQGRFPLRCELDPLGVEDFKRILREPQNALTKQYAALLATEGVEIEFTDDGIDEIARAAAFVNEQSENIGARRLHTVMEKVLEDVLFEAGDTAPTKVIVDAEFVRNRLQDILKNQDLSRFIL
ncbi:MAG: ATP-dependent protease ATPase subunit HslU [Candidatus Hydrogenedentota bacterium]|jgi:ATP-dependent HslUV protease ATP-binding subunit HslU|uniref:ATP-dependent protease ATPase subunit HslU n=1 Tax=Sumerlaea chitinivorans TaxID=2250252 RepID=A0A2Z4Y7L4_SUMC1|nr:ATP-dependent hsl protease ATP-binding subunit HslU [Candidatus Sumerlaea chitinivorans]MCX7964281.1 ATP-dependent protease ATPase subunit HslU [Candidatus Sumerlaea chitinivorans]RMH26973.1 MAG: ATP-dependent protease ATPase subunit HslU [Candidatus Hydrogenedentota bacterium]